MKRIVFLMMLIIVAACKHKPAQLNVTPVANAVELCDSSANYAKDIQPIFKNNCYECHSTAVTQNGGLDLEDTASLKSYLKHQYHSDGQYGSELLHIIRHKPGTLQMPPTYIIDTCSINKIQHWINLGAPTS